MRLIDADALMEKLTRMIDYCKADKKVNGLTALFQVGDAIMDCPTIEAESVKHREWKMGKSGYMYFCNNCEFLMFPWEASRFCYCPGCGSKNDLEG